MARGVIRWRCSCPAEALPVKNGKPDRTVQCDEGRRVNGPAARRNEAARRADQPVPHARPVHGSYTFLVDDGRNLDGTRRQARRSGFWTIAEATEALTAMQAAPTRGRTVDGRVTFAAFAGTWLDHVRSTRAESTAAVYERRVKLAVAQLGHLRMTDVTESDVEDFLRRLPALSQQAAAARPGQRGMSTATVKLVRSTLGVLFGYAVKRKVVRINPVTAADVELPASPARRATWWTGPQLATFLEAAHGAPLGALFARSWARRVCVGARRLR